MTDEQAGALAAYVNLLLRWNRTINLTAIRDFGGAVRKHVAEGAFLADRIPSEILSVCDLGSGGGVPGIPVGILRPNATVALVEIDVRKSVFLREASRSLPNVRVVNAGFEEVTGHYDWLVSRAVNLNLVRSGPEADHAAVLAGDQLGREGVAARFSWSRSPVPWPGGGFLWTGDVSRETSTGSDSAEGCFT